MNFNASLRRAIKTGTVFLGQKSTEKCIEEGKSRLVVEADNCQPDYRTFIGEKAGDCPVHTYNGSSVHLGKACGKPFVVSVLAIADPGESDLLNLKSV